MDASLGKRQLISFPLSFTRAAALAGCLVCVHLALSLGLKSNPSLRVAANDLLLPIANGLAALGLFYGACCPRQRGGHVRVAWTVLAVAQACLMLGDLVWAFVELVLGRQPFPSLADAFYLMFYPLFAVGIFLLPAVSLAPGERLKMALDLLVVMIAAILFSWIFVIAPTIHSNGADVRALVVSVTYPVLDLVLLFALLELLFRRLRMSTPGPLLLLAAGVAITISADGVFAYTSLHGTYTSGHWVDTTFVLSYVLIGLAGVLHAVEPSSGPPLSAPAADGSRYGQFTWTLYLPHAAVVVTYLLLAWGYSHSLPLPFPALLAGVGSIVGLILVRQVVALQENARFYRAVEREIAERRRIEEALRRQAAELQARNEELDAFAHTVAHDLKNPLGLIMGYADVALEDTACTADEKQYAGAIGRAARRMDNIIRELLLLSEVRKAEVALEPVDMAATIAEARQRLAHMIDSHDAQIVTPEVWPAALGYGSWIEEVWINYLSNGIKYGGRPPRLELGWDEVASQPVSEAVDLPVAESLTRSIADSSVRFWVRDNGPGLKPEDQARLFAPFTRLDRVRAEGHGLGLSIVRRIVEKLGGEVQVESDVGSGSTFSFTLRKSEAEQIMRSERS